MTWQIIERELWSMVLRVILIAGAVSVAVAVVLALLGVLFLIRIVFVG